MANQYLKNGNYQAAIEVGAQKMRRNPKKADKTILAIERAFKIEKSRILDKVNQLKIDGNPENWVSIYNLYKQLDQYQKALKQMISFWPGILLLLKTLPLYKSYNDKKNAIK